MEKATLGGGCFWCIEAIYKGLKGVETAISGYAGGEIKDPSYKEVCNGTTGHAEVVQLTYDPEVVSYKDILEIFFTVHDPTTPNRQGNDVGPQYRSIVLYHNEEQAKIAKNIITEFENKGIWGNPIVTELKPLDMFYQAEDYHQDYYENNKNQPYCRFVIEPKVAKFRKKFLSKLKHQ